MSPDCFGGHYFVARTSLPCAHTCAIMQLKRVSFTGARAFNIVVTL